MTIEGISQLVGAVRQALRGRFVRLLEEQVAREREEVARQRAEVTRERAEISRLRLENRALLNSVLGTAGVPPIETPPAHPAQIAPVRRRSWPQIAHERERNAGASGGK